MEGCFYPEGGITAKRAWESIELLEIKNEAKLEQYVDDTAVLLSDVQSVLKLFDLLSLFQRCSGLKLYQTKSEMIWLGATHHRKDVILNLQMSSEPVYAFGVHFAYDQEVSEKKILGDKLGSLKKILNIWFSLCLQYGT